MTTHFIEGADGDLDVVDEVEHHEEGHEEEGHDEEGHDEDAQTYVVGEQVAFDFGDQSDEFDPEPTGSLAEDDLADGELLDEGLEFVDESDWEDEAELDVEGAIVTPEPASAGETFQSKWQALGQAVVGVVHAFAGLFSNQRGYDLIGGSPVELDSPQDVETDEADWSPVEFEDSADELEQSDDLATEQVEDEQLDDFGSEQEVHGAEPTRPTDAELDAEVAAAIEVTSILDAVALLAQFDQELAEVESVLCPD